MDEILRILHPSLPTMSCENTCVGRSVPMKFKLNTNSTPDWSRSKKVFIPLVASSSSAYSLSVVALGLLPPAPFIKMSHLPNSLSTASRHFSSESLMSTLASNPLAV